MKKTTETKVNFATYIADKVDELNTSRETWEQGSFKQSNEELYDILNDPDCVKNLAGRSDSCSWPISTVEVESK